MDGSIGHLHAHFRLHGSARQHAASRARLGRVLDKHLADAYATALDGAFGSDPRVIVIRDLRVRSFINLAAHPDDRHLARTWGAALARSVVHEIANGDGSRVVVFDNQAHYVADYLEEVLSQPSRRSWYFSSLRRPSERSVEEALLVLLADHRELLPETLARLRTRELLPRLLERLGPERARRLWEIIHPKPSHAEVPAFERLSDSPPAIESYGEGPADEALRNAAAEVADLLDLWRGYRRARRTLFRGFVARRLPDWRDPVVLGQYVADLLQFLLDRGLIALPSVPFSLSFERQLEEALSSFSWLNPTSVELVLRGGAARAGTATPSPRQLAVVDALLQAVNQKRADVQCAAARGIGPLQVTLFALLAEIDEGMAADATSQRLVECLATAMLVARERTLGQSERHRQSTASIQRALSVVESLGPSAKRLVVAATEGGSAHRQWLECEEAGALLCLRTLSELRIPSVERMLGFEEDGASGSLWLPLLLLIGRGPTEVAMELPVGFGSLSEPAAEASLAAFGRQWRKLSHERVVESLVDVWRTLASQRLTRGQQLCVYCVDHAGQEVWVAGDGDSGYFPWWTSDLSERGFRRLFLAWSSVYGRPPQHVTVDEGGSVPPGGDVEHIDVRSGDDSGDGSEPAACHRRNRSVLVAALREFDARLPLASRDYLTLTLLAISVLRTWARWLPKFGIASVPYLLKEVVRRPGRVWFSERELRVQLQAAPLDVLIELAGYTQPFERVPWLGGRTVHFMLGGHE